MATDDLLASQQSGYSRGTEQRLRNIGSPEGVKLTDSASDFAHQQHMLGSSQTVGGTRQGSQNKQRAYQQYQQSRMPMADNEEPDIPQFKVSAAAMRGGGSGNNPRTTNHSYADA